MLKLKAAETQVCKEDHASVVVEGEAAPFCQRTTEGNVSSWLHVTVNEYIS